MARAATSPELALYRMPGKWSVLRCAVLPPPIVYRARINQTFSTYDQVLTIIFDNGSGTLDNVLPDMEVWIGSSLDAHDKGICRLRDKDATHFYVSETSEIQFADNDYVTILAGYGAWARPVRIDSGTVYMDETAYSDQHASWDPMPNMGPHKVAELVGSSVNVGFDGSSSFCPGSSISAWAWSCATAVASAGETTSTCTLQFDSVGWHIVYLTLTAANGKSFFGVRYVYIWDQANPPPMALISNPGRCDVDSGGWEIELTLFAGASLTDFYDRAMVVLFAEDHYGDTVDEIGPVAGAENIRFVGWISGEAHHIESEQPSVTFRAHGAAYWMSRIPSWSDGVEIVNTTPDSWTEVQALTVDLGVYHFLRWRSTITRIMDVTLTGDTRYSPEVSSSAQNLWAQLQDMTWAQIYARPGVNALNQLSIQVHPCLIPTASRTAPTVMAITQADYADGLDFERSVVDEVGIVDMSGIAVDADGNGSAYFALAPGHSLPHYGEWDLQPNVLIEDQAQVITLAGLYRSWRNNPLKDLPIVFDAPIALLDCFPNQKCTIALQAADSARGYAYSGGLIPTSVSLVQDPDTGYLHTEATFEAETAESTARVGDTPGSGSTDGPVTPSFPPLPPLPPIVPGGFPQGSPGGPVKVLLHDANVGLLYSANFNAASPTWALVNGGLTGYKITKVSHMFVTPNGAVYVACLGTIGNADRGTDDPDAPWIAYAPSIGGAFTIIKDEDTLWADYPATTTTHGIAGIGYNPLVAESVTCIMGEALGFDASNAHIWLGAGGTFAQGVAIPRVQFNHASSWITYGQNTWMWIANRDEIGDNGAWWRVNAACSSLLGASSGLWDISENEHFRASTTGILFVRSDVTRIRKSIDNGATWTSITTGKVNQGDCDPTGQYLMSAYNNKSRSADGAASWYAIPNLPPGDAYYFRYAGGEGAASRFIAARGVVRYSPDFGETWENKEGNITSIAPTPSINMIHVVEY